MRRLALWWLLCVAGAALAQPAAERVLDDFADPAAWHLGATDDVRASLRPANGPNGPALCVDYDFGRTTGYVTLRRELPIDFPARYGLELGVRGNAVATFQFKLVDAGGENVWWVSKPAFRWPAEWQRLKLRQRQVAFAWGPAADRALRRTAAVELVVVSGAGAPRGTACFERLVFRTLPPEPPQMPPARMSADGVDFGVVREFDTLALRWPPGTAPSRYAIELSDDGRAWRRVREVERARGDVQTHWLPESESRRVRIVGSQTLPALAAIEPGSAASVDAFFARLAEAAPPGRYPRAYAGQQTYWTVFGVDGGPLPSLLGEDGAVEPVPGAGALEPMLVVDGRLRTWADAETQQRLRDGDLPMPSVHWALADDALALDIEAFGSGTPASAQALVTYRLTNRSDRPRRAALVLAWRPFQVNPPTQFLAHPGGASLVARLAWDGAALAVDGVVRVRPLAAPSAVRLEPLAAGPVGDWAAEAEAGPRELVDPAGFASAALRYDLALAPGESREVAVSLPVSGDPRPPGSVRDEAARVAAHWRGRLDRVRLAGPPEVMALAETVRSALGHILVNRSGAALQPGPRAYARSWIRDGALTSSALLRLGQDDVARDFLAWYAPFQFANGKIPCCASAQGADPVPENDSDGEFLYAAADHWRLTRDTATARALWPRVRAAAEHMESLRAGERSAANREPARRAYFGLMPPSISHEGYSDKPAYSYWDDFWAAIGDRSAVQLAGALGFPDDARRFAERRDAFLADLRASLVESTRRHGLSVVPGSADRGDVDPTSTTVALAPGGLLGVLPENLLRNTFERYWQDFTARRDGRTAWRDYTPYEWRAVGAFVRLGERDRALAAVRFLRADRRPPGWNQWAEVVMRDPREPHFLGDMPHGWVASDQIRSVLDLFAHEREADEALVLAAGVPLRWLAGEGVRLEGLRTAFGPLSWSMKSQPAAGRRETVEIVVQRLRDAPPGGVILQGPWPDRAQVSVDGQAVAGPASAIRLRRTPARVRVSWAAPWTEGIIQGPPNAALHRFSFRQLLLLAFLLITLLLGVASLRGIFALEGLIQRSSDGAQRAIALSAAAQSLAERSVSLERAARQYIVLQDPAFRQRFDESVRDASEALARVEAGAVPGADGQAWRAQLARIQDELSLDAAAAPSRDLDLSAAFRELEQIDAGLAEQVRRANEQRNAVLRDEIEAGRTRLARQMLAAIGVAVVLALAFGVWLARPLVHLERAIVGLGENRLDEPVEMQGPSDLRLLGRRLEWLRLRLVELDADKARFLRHVSHELKTPLAALREGVALLEEGVTGELSENQREVARILRQNTVALQNQIEDLLRFNAAAFEARRLVRQRTELVGLIRDRVEQQRLQWQARRLAVEITGAPLFLQADPERLGTAFGNLLSNAIRYSPPEATIRIAVSRLPGRAVVDIADEGPGIATAERARVFEPFFRGELQPEDAVRGSGIGLSIVQEYIVAHGGQIELLAEGPGARFHIELPHAASD